MSVDNRKPVLVVFRGYFPGWVGTEGADLVVKGWGVVYQLGFIQVLIEELHDLIPYLDADAYVHGPYLGFNAVSPQMWENQSEPSRPMAETISSA